MATQTDTSLKFNNVTFNHIAKIVPTEQLDEKWKDIPTRPSPTPEEFKVMSMLEERLGEAKQSKQKKMDIWNFSYLQYRSVNHTSMLYGGYPTYWNSWGMGVFIPRTFETIESIKVQMMGRQPDFTVKPTFPKTTPDANALNELTHSEWDRSKSQREVAETVHDALVYGAGIIRTDVLNKRKVEHVLKWNEDGSISYNAEEVTKYYGVGCRRVDPYDLYPNPSPEAVRFDTMGWCFERSVTDAWDLREEYRLMAESGAIGVTDNWQYLTPGGDISNYKYLRQEVDALYNRSDVRYPGTISDLIGNTHLAAKPITSTSRNKVEVWEYFEDDRYIVMANGLILRDSPNPYPHKQIPYVKYCVVNMNEFWGIGIPEYMRWLQICENILYDQGLNNIIMTVHKMFAVNSRYIEDEGELVARPFGIIHIKQIPNAKIQDAIMPIEYNHNMGNYFEFMRLNTQNIQTVTGVSPYQTGGVTEESKVDRATVANRLAFAGSARIREISRHLEDELVTGIIEQYVANIQFYYQNASAFATEGLPVEVNKQGKPFYLKYIPRSSGVITAEDKAQAAAEGYVGVIAQDQIQGRYKCTVQGGSTLAMDQDEKARLMLQFAQFAQTAVEQKMGTVTDPKTGLPSQGMVPTPIFDMKRIAQDVAKEMFNISDPEEYLYKAEQPTTESNPTDGAPPTVPGMPETPANAVVENANPQVQPPDMQP